MTARQLLTLTEVARATGKSRTTVRRALDSGQFPGAVRDDDAHGTWRVPASDLRRLGWTVHDTAAQVDNLTAGTDTEQSTGTPTGVGLVPWSEVLGLVDRNSTLQSELADARVELARVQFRLEAAERQLAANSQQPQVLPAATQQPAARRRWSRRT